MDRLHIEYAPRVPYYRRSIARRIMLFVVVLCALIPMGWAWGPLAWRHAELLYWQKAAMDYSAPAARVVYEDDRAKAAALLATSPEYVSTSGGGPAMWFARPWKSLYEAYSPPGRRPAAVLFLHERRTPVGNARLVVVEGRPIRPILPGDPHVTFAIQTIVFRPGSPFSASTMVQSAGSWTAPDLTNVSGKCVRFYAGQIDPLDPSHLTIAYDVDGRQSLIDGWLRDDDTLTLERRIRDQSHKP